MTSTPNRGSVNVCTAPHSPAGSTCGYESPSEENHAEFFALEHGLPQRHKSAGPTMNTTLPTIRPAFVMRPSYMASAPPDIHGPNTSARSNQSSLNDVLYKSKQQPQQGKVGIRDRIACYKWTFFTMVSEYLRTLYEP